jgi:hypothetical protein
VDPVWTPPSNIQINKNKKRWLVIWLVGWLTGYLADNELFVG